MKKIIRKLFGDSLIYGIAGVVSSLLSIFLVPFYTRIFVPADYGIIAIVTTTFTLLNILVVFGMDNSVCVWYWDKPTLRSRHAIFNTFIGFIGITGVTAALIILIFSRLLSNLFFGSYLYSTLFILLAFNLLFSGFQKVVNIWCRMRQRPAIAMSYSLVLVIVNLSLNIILVLYMKVGVSGVFYSQAATSITGFIMLIILFRRWINLKVFDKHLLKKMVKFSAPLVPAGLMYWLMTVASAYFIKFYIKDNVQVGLYQVGASIAGIISLITYSFFQAWGPLSLQISLQKDAKKIYSRVFEMYCILGFFFAFALLPMASNILQIFTNYKYLDAAMTVGLLGINVVLAGVPNFIAIANNLAKKNASYAIAISIGAIITVALFIILIPSFGKEGAAIAMICGNLSASVYLGYKVHYIYPIPYNYLTIIIIVGIELFFFIVIRLYIYNLSLQVILAISLFALISIGYAIKYKFRLNKR